MKKQLLKESEIRKMMKFANIGALTDGFVERINETYYGDDPELEEALGDEDDTEAADDETGGEEVGGQTLPGGEDVGGQSMPNVPAEDAGVTDVAPMTGEEGTTEPVEVDREVLKQAIKTIIDGLETTMQKEFGEEAPGLEATEVEDVEAADAGGEEALPAEEPLPGGEEVGGQTLPGGEDVGGQSLPTEPGAEDLEEDFINEMTRKVAARLLKAAKRR